MSPEFYIGQMPRHVVGSESLRMTNAIMESNGDLEKACQIAHVSMAKIRGHARWLEKDHGWKIIIQSNENVHAVQLNPRDQSRITDVEPFIRHDDKISIDKSVVKEIIQYVVETTRPRWSQWDQTWSDVDRIFIRHGYGQQGFEIDNFVPLLEERNIYGIDHLGLVLETFGGPVSYNRQYASLLNSEFYSSLQLGKFGNCGQRLFDSIRVFLEKRLGSRGRAFWKLIWYMLIACRFLRLQYKSSFSYYILEKYRAFSGLKHLSQEDFLSLTENEWHYFLGKARPWSKLYGIGQNVFDFIFRDIVEAEFAKSLFKFDSANKHFLTVTGIADCIVPFERSTTIKFLRELNLRYFLREINKGIYTYCSLKERDHFGFCRFPSKCKECGVSEICRKKL